MSRDTADLLERAKRLSVIELRELCAELLRLTAQPIRSQTTAAPAWNSTKHRQWLKQTWGERVFSDAEVEEMRNAEDSIEH